MERGTFVADMILAKHDERYMPPQLGNQSAEHKAGKTLDQIKAAGLPEKYSEWGKGFINGLLISPMVVPAS